MRRILKVIQWFGKAEMSESYVRGAATLQPCFDHNTNRNMEKEYADSPSLQLLFDINILTYVLYIKKKS